MRCHLHIRKRILWRRQGALGYRVAPDGRLSRLRVVQRSRAARLLGSRIERHIRGPPSDEEKQNGDDQRDIHHRPNRVEPALVFPSVLPIGTGRVTNLDVHEPAFTGAISGLAQAEDGDEAACERNGSAHKMHREGQVRASRHGGQKNHCGERAEQRCKPRRQI